MHFAPHDVIRQMPKPFAGADCWPKAQALRRKLIAEIYAVEDK